MKQRVYTEIKKSFVVCYMVEWACVGGRHVCVRACVYNSLMFTLLWYLFVFTFTVDVAKGWSGREDDG